LTKIISAKINKAYYNKEKEISELHDRQNDGYYETLNSFFKEKFTEMAILIDDITLKFSKYNIKTKLEIIPNIDVLKATATLRIKEKRIKSVMKAEGVIYPLIGEIETKVIVAMMETTSPDSIIQKVIADYPWIKE